MVGRKGGREKGILLDFNKACPTLVRLHGASVCIHMCLRPCTINFKGRIQKFHKDQSREYIYPCMKHVINYSFWKR